MNIEELRSTQSELMIQHAEVGCALIGKDLPVEAADWINEGVSIATKMNDATSRQLMTIENADKIIQNLSIMDSELLEGAVDLKKISENSKKLKESIRRNHITWRIVLKAIAAALDLKIETKPTEPIVEETKTDLPKLQQTFPKMLPELSKRLSAIRESDRQIVIPGFPLEQFKITKSGDIIDRTVDRAVKPTLRNGIPELFQARNAATGKIETVPIKEITLPPGYSIAAYPTDDLVERVFKPLDVISIQSKGKLDTGFVNDFTPPWVRIKFPGLKGVYMYNPETHIVVNGFTGQVVNRTMDGKQFTFPGKLIPCEDIFNKYPMSTCDENSETSSEEWLPLNIDDRLPKNRFVYNKNTREVVDRRTGMKVEWRPFGDGTYYLFDVDHDVINVKCEEIDKLFGKPVITTSDTTTESVTKTAPKEDLKIPPRKIIIEAKPIDWLGPMIDTTRYKIYSDGSIEDTLANHPVVPFDGCKVKLQSINGSEGIWNLHELVWAAFHPDDRTKIRVTGSVFKINGHINDNRLSNLVFKPSTTVPTTTTVNSPTQINLKENDSIKEHTHERKPDDDGSRYIDWIPGVDPTKYTISRDGKVRNRHANSKEVSSKFHAGKLCIKLQGKKGRNATYTIADLVNKAFPDQPEAIRSSGKFRIEDVTKPFDFNTYSNVSKEKEDPVKETPTTDTESERKIPVDWIDGIPSTKYLVSEKGYVFNTISGKKIIPNASGTINMSDSIDKGSRKMRIHMKMESLIWKAFHAEDRQLEKVYLEHIDGDVTNCAIKNLRKKIVDRKS